MEQRNGPTRKTCGVLLFEKKLGTGGIVVVEIRDLVEYPGYIESGFC